MSSLSGRFVSLVLLMALSLPTTGCMRGATSEQRRECRQARAAAAGRAFGLTLGVVVLVAVLVAADGNAGSLGSGRRRRSRRQRRLAVCRHPAERNGTMPVSRQQPAPSTSTPTPVTAGEPPTQEDLQSGIAAIEAPLRECAPGGSGDLVIDAAIDGATGRVRDFGLRGDAAATANPPCVADRLGRLQFTPFPGTVEVQWGLRF